MRKNFIYRHLASTKTAIYLLLVLSLFFLIGTIFPQGVGLEEYREAGGKFIFGARYLGFLNIFQSPLFLLAGLLLALNTLVCTAERIIVLARRRPGEWHPGKEGRRSYAIPAGSDVPGLLPRLKAALKKRGYKLRREEAGESGATLTFARGIDLTITSILSHAGIFLCLALFYSTHYLSYENVLTLYPGETKEVELPGEKRAPFQLKLNEFSTLYEDNPKIEFPPKAHMKIAALVSKAGEKAAFTLEPGAVAVSDWISDLSVQRGGKEVLRKKVEVNVPLRHGGFTFYQMGYDQEVELKVGGETRTISPGKRFEGKNEEKLMISGVRHGTLNRIDGTREKIKPFFSLYRLKEGGSRKDREKLGDLSLGERRQIMGMAVTFSRFKEASVLSYRVDPSVGILYYLSFLVIVLITARLYLRQSRVKVVLASGDGDGTVTVSLRSEGALSSRQDEERKIADVFAEIRLVELNPPYDSSSTS
ncbi:MAG: hypothetical protein GTN70_00820 [Deltaproteobacteria bacterium]|nr:hypothetical protein [Deltaproteobacteria bacterium]NIS76197.1 hypothetical protein [Deltaproteobacteria bacterium]